MIKFFRHIRRSLIQENKMGKDFRYAIGEILLVVIGILIALQINNWNENRKERFVELKILQSINNDIQEDLSSLKEMISFEQRMLSNNEALLSILDDKNSVYNSDMKNLFGTINRYGVFYPQKIGYESLKSIGLEILQSDSLRADIVNLYDSQYGLILESLDIKKQTYLNTNEIFVRELKTVDRVIFKEPINFNALKENSNFINHLSHIYYERRNLLDFAESSLVKMKTVKEKIEVEIKSFSK